MLNDYLFLHWWHKNTVLTNDNASEDLEDSDDVRTDEEIEETNVQGMVIVGGGEECSVEGKFCHMDHSKVRAYVKKHKGNGRWKQSNHMEEHNLPL